jgi:hypothetical protein
MVASYLLEADDARRAINMALHEMSAEPAVRAKSALKIYATAAPQHL